MEHGNMNLSDVVSLKSFCETHGIDAKRARRMAHRDVFPGAFQFMGNWVIARDADVPDMSDVRATRTRADGRKRYVVYMTDIERVTIIGIIGADNVIDVRAVAKQRRIDKKTAVIEITKRANANRERLAETMEIDDIG